MARGRVLSQVLTVLEHAGPLPAMQRFAAHLRTELPALLSFLFDATVDATNWRAEQALRPAVVNRKVSGGNRSARGADTQHVLDGRGVDEPGLRFRRPAGLRRQHIS